MQLPCLTTTARSGDVTVFAIASAVLILLVLGSVLAPLWRDKPPVGIGVLIGLSAVTAMLYSLVGTPAALDAAQRRPPANIADAVTQLESELTRDPTQLDGWRLLANAYSAVGRSQDAQAALVRALALAPDDADLLTQVAEARAMGAPNRRFDAQGTAMLQRALARQPMHERARWFLGIAQRQASQPAAAAATWEPLLATVDARTGASLREQIDAARRDAGLAALPAVAAPAAGITVSVSLDPALGMRLAPDAVVFVIARRPGGPPMPVAVEKFSAARLPQVITLDDNDSPMPTQKLSQLATVEITARVSASGDALPHAGDFDAVPVRLRKGQTAAAVLIDRVVE
jgi:cytochrome c-type biogenesis protein CcmH